MTTGAGNLRGGLISLLRRQLKCYTCRSEALITYFTMAETRKPLKVLCVRRDGHFDRNEVLEIYPHSIVPGNSPENSWLIASTKKNPKIKDTFELCRLGEVDDWVFIFEREPYENDVIPLLDHIETCRSVN